MRTSRTRSRTLAVAAVLALLPQAALAAVSVNPPISYNSSYTVSWTDVPAPGQRVYLAQSLNGGAWTRVTVTGTNSRSYSGMASGDYGYKLQVYDFDVETRREILNRQTAVVTVRVWTSVPAAPGPVSGPPTTYSGSYTLSWTAPPGVVTRYELLENGVPALQGGQALNLTAPSASLSGRGVGGYSYAARACNGLN